MRAVKVWLGSLSCAVLALTVFSAVGRAENAVEDIKVTFGKSFVIDYPVDVGRISTSDPAVVDYVPISVREILIHAKGLGAATLVVWSKTGERSFYNVTVGPNLEPIRELIKETFPDEKIEVQSAGDSLSLTGFVSSQSVADRLVQMVTPYAKTVVNNLGVAAPGVQKQILLRVRFAELDRNAGNRIGINIVSTAAGGNYGRTTTGQFPAPVPAQVGSPAPGQSSGAQVFEPTFSLSDALNVFLFRPDLNLGAFIAALRTEGILQILAEPNLVTTDGKEASFLVGGEFPIPVLQGGGNSGAVTVQFREYGIRLNFTPNITPNDTIRMYIKPEVSTIDLANAVTLSGFTIPALATRRMETNIELGEGQSFVIAGLIDDRVQESMSKIPGLSSVPILGELFKSREVRKNKTELVVMVTPEITEPLRRQDPKPMPVMPEQFLKPYNPGDMSKATGSAGKQKN